MFLKKILFTTMEAIIVNKNSLYYLMQMNGGTFPTGGFSQSWGLETYVSEGTVHNSQTFRLFLDTYLDAAVGRCEGPIICKSYELAQPLQEKKFLELEELSNAAKVTKESRESSIRMGKAFLRLMESILCDAKLIRISRLFKSREVSYPVIYGAVCRLLGLDLEDAVRAYVYSTANTLVQSALKLVPLGNTEGQLVLFEAAEAMEAATSLSMKIPIDDITNFCPGMDIASIHHETLSVRLYMS